MVLATLVDVKRLLKRTDTSSDAELTSALSVAEQWVRDVYGGQWDRSGTVVDTFYTVRQDQILWLKDPNPGGVIVITATQVTTYPGPGTFPLDITTFQQLDNGRIQLFYNRFVAPRGYDTPVASGLPGYYDKVDVTYTASGVVPYPVRDAVALIAAAHWAMSTANIGNLQSETIGAYTYSRLAQNGSAIVIPAMARALLRPYVRGKLSARVT